jgi:hypothetical protein
MPVMPNRYSTAKVPSSITQFSRPRMALSILTFHIAEPHRLGIRCKQVTCLWRRRCDTPPRPAAGGQRQSFQVGRRETDRQATELWDSLRFALSEQLLTSSAFFSIVGQGMFDMSLLTTIA